MKIKIMILILICSIFIPIIIISIIISNYINNAENYVSQSKWNCNDDKFLNEYLPYYENEINTLFEDVKLDMNKNIVSNYSYSHSIIYNNDKIYLEFTFINDKKFAKCLIDCYVYSSNYNELLLNNNIETIINIIEKFSSNNVFDHHNGYDNILEELNNDLVNDNNTKSFRSYQYHYDSLVGSLGYCYELSSTGDIETNYFDPLKIENRACFQINYTAILNGILE